MTSSTEPTSRTGRRGAGLDELLKRALDVTASAAGLVLLSPVFGAIALAVKAYDRGPVFHRAERIGRDGKPFRLYKFRSMVVNADRMGPGVTAGSDDRITPIGRRLRHWKLDEFPQLINVLRGEMSLVGPRPEAPGYVRHYTDEQRRVLEVRPGITGVSQLEFRHEEALLAGRSDVEEYYLTVVMPAKLSLDLRYVDERTTGRDLLLIFRTLAAIAGRSPKTPPELPPR
jgi:lipopolysaccharide/colanic/teichoic acid biosynthesis glycosyltransferase